MANKSSLLGTQEGYVLLQNEEGDTSPSPPVWNFRLPGSRWCHSVSIVILMCVVLGTTLWIMQDFETIPDKLSFEFPSLENFFAPTNVTATSPHNADLSSSTPASANTVFVPTFDPAQPDSSPDALSDLMKHLQNVVSGRLNKAGDHLKNATADKDALYLSHGIIQGGLGNFMFMVGSTWGLAKTNHRRMVLLEKHGMEANFENLGIDHVSRASLFGSDSSNNYTFGETSAMKYTPKMENITAVKGSRNVLLAGYMQSWKYFDHYRENIRSLFTFSKAVYEKSLSNVQERLEDYYTKLSIDDAASIFSDRTTRPTLITIHVRRGDIATSDQQMRHGHKPATKEYLLRTTSLLSRKYSSMIFLVINNDMPYCRDLFKDPNYVFMDNNRDPPAVDMAIISLADHIILSVGTFGWWAAYLSDAKDVYYYKDWPRKGSDMEKLINPEDYFYPSWTPLE